MSPSPSGSSRGPRTSLLGLLCALPLAACSGGTASPEPAQAAGPLVVGCDTNFMPFEFERDGQYVGFDIDLWAAVAEELGREYQLRPMDFNGLIPALQAGSIDVAMAGMTIKAERERNVDFSYPYYQAGLQLMVGADADDIDGIDELDGRVVATRLGTTSADFAKGRTPATDVTLFPNIDGAYLELRSGGADAVLFDSPAVQHYAATDGKGQVQVVGPLYEGQAYGFAFPQGSALREPVDIALLTLMEDGRYDALHDKWFGGAAE